MSLCFRERRKTGRETEWKESEKNGEEEKSKGGGLVGTGKRDGGGVCAEI